MLREKEKLRDAIPATALARMREYLNNNNKHFLLACMMEYYTFIRPDELRHLRIGDISVANKEVTVPADVSKNHKERRVGLNTRLLRMMNELRVFDSPSDYYLFGEDLHPGGHMTYVNSFRYEWKKMQPGSPVAGKLSVLLSERQWDPRPRQCRGSCCRP